MAVTGSFGTVALPPAGCCSGAAVCGAEFACSTMAGGRLATTGAFGVATAAEGTCGSTPAGSWSCEASACPAGGLLKTDGGSTRFARAGGAMAVVCPPRRRNSAISSPIARGPAKTGGGTRKGVGADGSGARAKRAAGAIGAGSDGFCPTALWIGVSTAVSARPATRVRSAMLV